MRDWVWVFSALICAGCAAPWDDCLVVPTEEVDFGEVALSTSARKTITIENPRTAPRMVIIEPNLAPFGPAAETVLVLLAGGEKTVEFSFFPRDSRLHLGEAVVREDDPSCGVKKIPLRGMGAGQLMVLERPTFPPTQLGASSTQELVLFSSRRSVVTTSLDFDATLAAPAGTWSGPENVTLQPSTAVRVPITFTPREVGTWKGSVDVIASSGLAQRGEVLRVPLEGTAGLPRLELSRTQLNVSQAPLHGTIQRHVFVRNGGDGPLVFRLEVEAGPNSQPGELILPSAGPFELDPGQEMPVPFVIVPTTLGSKAWSLTFLTNNGVVRMPITAQSLDVVPCGTSVIATQSTPLIVAGPFPKTATFTLSNPNSVACLVTAIEFDAFTNWSLSLPFDDDTFVIGARAMVSHSISIPGSGTRFVRWRTFGAAGAEVMIIAN